MDGGVTTSRGERRQRTDRAILLTHSTQNDVDHDDIDERPPDFDVLSARRRVELVALLVD
jgi:hypothetical protein